MFKDYLATKPNKSNHYPEEMIGIIASQSNKFENMFNSFGGDTRKETKFDVSIICLQHKPTRTTDLYEGYSKRSRNIYYDCNIHTSGFRNEKNMHMYK